MTYLINADKEEVSHPPKKKEVAVGGYVNL